MSTDGGVAVRRGGMVLIRQMQQRAGWALVPGRPERNGADAFEACQEQPQPVPEWVCHRHRRERRGHRTSEKTIIFTPPSRGTHS